MPEYIHDIAVFVTALVAITTVFVGIVQFRTSSRMSAMAPFLTKRLELYEEITRCAGAICSTRDTACRSEATANFWQLYYGPMTLVEDGTVEAAMVEFGKLLKLEELNTELLEIAALELAVACRGSVSESWNLDLGTLIEHTV